MKKLFLIVSLLSFCFALNAQTMLLPVPYHSQGSPWFPPDSGYPAFPNNWCTVACLHMLFDYYDHMENNATPFPSQQIASVCNTDGLSPGTLQSDARRAAHFSILSNSADGSVTNGYTWRKIGYSVIDCDTTTIINGQHFLIPGTSGMVGWMEALNEGYPIVFSGRFPWLIGTPEGSPGDTTKPNYTEIGHSILLVGYSLNMGNPLQSQLFFHDPWYGPYVSYTVAQLQAGWPEGNFIFASPWEAKINAPKNIIMGTSFDVSASIRYSAPTVEYVQPNGSAFPQQFPVAAYPIAILQTDSCSLPMDIVNAVDTLYLIRTTQSSYIGQWSAVSGISGVNGSFRVRTVGLLQTASSASYPSYQDTIGGIVTGGCLYVNEDTSGMRLPEINKYKVNLSPNPFTNSNAIILSLPNAGKVEIEIFDGLGRVVKILSNKRMEQGKHILTWDGTDKNGVPLPAGKYFYSISVAGKRLPGEKAVLVK